MPIPKASSFVPPETGPRIISVGTSNPKDRYTQKDLVEMFKETDPKIKGLFLNSQIKTRHLMIPKPVNGEIPEESNQDLIDKHKEGMLKYGPIAIERCLKPYGYSPYDIDYICCVSSTGFLCPGISAHLIKEMGFRENIYRVDILGMGCNAGVNALQSVTNFCQANPGKLGLMVCVEICSAAYITDNTIGTAVVNSLFGDGIAAALVRQDEFDTSNQGPMVCDYESQIITEKIDEMRFELDGNKNSFVLGRDIPYVLGGTVEKPIKRLLGKHNLKIRDVDHWIIHSGGKKVIDAIEYNIGLTDYDVRNTLHVLNNYGNLSSGSFLFSYKELYSEGIVKDKDIGVAMVMGPGSTIETALLCW